MAYDESGRAARCRVVTALLAVALIVLVGANLCIGSVLVPADHIPGILSGGAANCLDERSGGTQEAFLVRIQDCHQGNLRYVQSLTQKVDAHQHIEHIQTQIADNLRAL